MSSPMSVSRTTRRTASSVIRLPSSSLRFLRLGTPLMPQRASWEADARACAGEPAPGAGAGPPRGAARSSVRGEPRRPAAGARRGHVDRLLGGAERERDRVRELADLLAHRLGLADVLELALAVDRRSAGPASRLALEAL